MNHRHLPVTLTLALVLLVVSHPFTPNLRADVGATLKAGTLGAGLDLTFPLQDTLNLRLEGNYFTYTYNHTFSDVAASAKLNLASGLALLDWHPGGHSFRFSAGAVGDGNKLNVTGNPTAAGTINLNGVTYSATQVGNLNGTVTFNSASPYAGIGFGNAVSKNGHWSVDIDLGVMFQGTPKFTYNANGTLAADPNFQANLNAEASKVRHDLTYFQYYPVIALGLSYRF